MAECECDTTHPAQPTEFTLGDGFEMLDKINRRVTFGGFNAREVKELKKIRAEQWAKIRSEYNSWAKVMKPFPVFWTICGLGSGIAYFYLGGTMKTTALAIFVSLTAFVFAKMVEREGHREGYFDGYEAGCEDGVNRALGVTEDDLQFINDAAIDMDLHARRRASSKAGQV